MEEKKLLKRLEKAKESGKLDDWELCCRRLAEYYSSHGNDEEALKAYQEELSVCEAKGDPNGLANAHRMVGEIYTNLGQFSESLDHVKRYLEFARKSKNSVEQQRALATIGRTYFCWASALKESNDTEDVLQANLKLKECRKALMKSLQICEEGIQNISSRERQEMKARLLLNLGLASEIEDDLVKAAEFVQRSIAICKQENLLEDLHKCYGSLSAILMKQNDPTAALVAIDNACEIAKNVDNSNEALVSALLYKSEIYYAIRNYRGARAVLKKAYKLKSPNEQDMQIVEISLKRAILICDLEAKLPEIDENSLLERKEMFEKLGDACCLVKNFKHAVEFYKNMTDCALSLGQSGKQLQPCYVSLYKTYQDDEQYDLALEYARKEFELSKGVPVETIKSHLVIGEILELNKGDYFEISKEYIAAQRLAEEIGDKNLLSAALGKLASLQRNDGRIELAELTEKHHERIGKIESDDSPSEDETSPTDGVHLSDLSDSDDEMSRVRPSRSKFKLTKNEKGETPLHVAAIKGDVARVKRLVACGHPVKERDKAGWTPLHEAANHGYVEIVKILLEAGADINDPGGKECKSITPLHDAGYNGHLEVIRLLLENKASVTVITDDGETPLDCIKTWKDGIDTELDEEEEKLYNEIVQNLESKLKAAGFQSKKSKENENSSQYPTQGRGASENKKFKEKKSSNLNLRRESNCGERRRNWGSVSPDREESNSSSPVNQPEMIDVIDSTPTNSQQSLSNDSPPRKPVADYRAAINALRKRPFASNIQQTQAPKSALIAEGSYIDEWLEDDLRQNRAQKKRKICDFMERGTTRKNLSETRRDSDEFPDFFFPLDDPVDFPNIDKQAKKKPKLQTTIINSGFRVLPSPDVEEMPVRPTTPPPADTNLDFPSLPSPPFSSVSDHQVLTKVRVNVGQFTLLIPVDSSKVSELTVRWLAEEAGRRYSELEGAEPQLQLKTRDGAMIAATDPVSVTLGEDLESTIVGWKTASLTERYQDALSQEQSRTASSTSAYGAYICGPDIAVMERLAACDLSKWLDLSYMSLTENELNPILRALRHERSLRVLDVAGNILGDAGLTTLTQCLENCSLEEMNLRCNNITAAGVAALVNKLPTMSNNFLTSLRSIDLSFNPVGELTADLKDRLHSSLPNLSQFKTDYSKLPN